MAEAMLPSGSTAQSASNTPRRSEVPEKTCEGPSKNDSKSTKSAKAAQKATKTTAPQVRTDFAGVVSNVNKEVMLILRDLNNNLNKQNEKVEAQNARIEHIAQQLDSFYYDENVDLNEPEELEQYETFDTDSEPPIKIQKTDDSVFKSLSEKFQSTESVDPEVNDDLAAFVNNAFRNGINEEKQTEILKNIHRPINCDSLVKTRVNQGIWRLLKAQTQTDDSKMQGIQNLIVKASSCITKLLDKCGESLDSEDVDWGTSALALLGQANKQLNNRRKEMHKSDLDPKYHYLASSSLPFTERLYGDDCDVNKNVREINDLNRIGRNIAKTYQRGGYRGRRPFRRGRGRGRWFPKTDSTGQSAPQQFTTPKKQKAGHKK